MVTYYHINCWDFQINSNFPYFFLFFFGFFEYALLIFWDIGTECSHHSIHEKAVAPHLCVESHRLSRTILMMSAAHCTVTQSAITQSASLTRSTAFGSSRHITNHLENSYPLSAGNLCHRWWLPSKSSCHSPWTCKRLPEDTHLISSNNVYLLLILSNFHYMNFFITSPLPGRAGDGGEEVPLR